MENLSIIKKYPKELAQEKLIDVFESIAKRMGTKLLYEEKRNIEDAVDLMVAEMEMRG